MEARDDVVRYRLQRAREALEDARVLEAQRAALPQPRATPWVQELGQHQCGLKGRASEGRDSRRRSSRVRGDEGDEPHRDTAGTGGWKGNRARRSLVSAAFQAA